MKNINISLSFFLSLCFAGLMLFSTACNGDDEYVNSSLKVSDTTFTLYSGGEDAFKVEVNSELEWNAMYESNGDWLYESEREVNSITVKALPNTTSETREGKIIVSDGIQKQEIVVYQLGLVGVPNAEGQLPIYRAVPRSQISPVVVSKNGKYAGGVEITVYSGNLHRAVAVVWDIQTEKELFRTEIEDNINRLYPVNITENGDILCVSSVNTSFLVNSSGNPVSVEVPSGYTSGVLENISDDGKVWVGFGAKNGINHPLKWVNGVPQELPLPSPDDLYTPTRIIYGEANGTHALGSSSDGSIVYGATATSAAGVYWDASGQFHFAGREILGDPQPKELYSYYYYTVPEGPFAMSPNGRYLVSLYAHPVEVDNYAGDEEMPSIFYPALLDVETGATTLYKQYTDKHALGLAITDDGIMSLANGRIINIHTGEVHNTDEWIKTKYGLDLAGNIQIHRFCDDGETILVRYDDGAISSWTYSYFYIYYPKN